MTVTSQEQAQALVRNGLGYQTANRYVSNDMLDRAEEWANTLLEAVKFLRQKEMTT